MRRSSFRKFIPLFLTVGFILFGFVFVQQAHADVPIIISGVVDVTNTYVDVTFSEGVYNNAVEAVSSTDVLITQTATGTATVAEEPIGVSQNDGETLEAATPLGGGEDVVRVFLNITGTPNGQEVIEIGPQNETAICDSSGENCIAGDTTTDPITLFDRRVDLVFPNPTFTSPGETISINPSYDASNAIWFAPPEITTSTDLVAGSDMTTAAGDATSILAPEDQGTYKLYVVDSEDNISLESMATLAVVSTVSYPGGSAGEIWTEKRLVGDTNQNWYSVASDSDGSHLMAAVQGGRLYISSNSGVTWTETRPVGNVDKNWQAVAISSDSSTFIAGNDTRLYISTSSGTTWTETQPAGNNNRPWASVATDSDGSTLIAAATSASHPWRLYISTSSGATWTETQPAGNNDKYWASVATNSDGSTLMAGVRIGSPRLYISTSSGATWAEARPAGNVDKSWRAIASDSNGSHLIAGAYGGRLYTSSDGGGTWIEIRPGPAPLGNANKNWYSVASNADGSVLVAGNYGGFLYIYPGGATGFGYVTLPPGNDNQNWQSVASSADGSRLIAGIYGGRLYTISMPLVPTVEIGNPSLSIASSTSNNVTFTITYRRADSVTLTAEDISLNFTGTATGTIDVSGTGTSTRTVTISNISGDGSCAISIPPGTATNGEGLALGVSGQGQTFWVNTTPPVVEFSIADNFYNATNFVEDDGYSDSTIHGHWDDSDDTESATFNIQNTATGQYWDFDGGWQSTSVASIAGVFGDDGLGGTNWFSGSTVPASMFEDWTTYIFTLTLTDSAGNTARLTDSFTWGAQEFNTDNIATLFTLPEGEDPDAVTQLTANDNIGATATSSAGMGGIVIPVDTVITKDDNSAFDATAITSDNATNVILGSSLMTAGVTLQGAVQFGILGTILHFSNPVIVRIPVIVLNGTVLDIRRSPDGGATWTTAGFTANSTDTCTNGSGSHPVTTVTVAGGYATIFTCQASDFATYSYSQPSSSYYYGGGGALTTTTATSTATTTLTTTATTTASTTPLTSQDLLASLIAQLKALILQAKAQGITVSPAAEAFIQGLYSFTRDLQLGMIGEDVRGLQIYLNSKGFIVASSGLGSVGNETTYYGNATRAALIKFQKASGISPAAGYFGPKTRAYISSHP